MKRKDIQETKNSKVMNYINDNVAMYEPDTATKEQLEGLEKRLANARAHVTPPKEEKKMSKQDIYNTYFNKKSPKYYKEEKTGKEKILMFIFYSILVYIINIKQYI